jgi:predicted GIY-YIG superfamily endonuclease
VWQRPLPGYAARDDNTGRPYVMHIAMPAAFHYVYILRSTIDPDRHYVGMTSDLQRRLRAHNAGESSHTAKHKPWTIEGFVAFSSRRKAAAFEKYLKSGSGRAFAIRHF